MIVDFLDDVVADYDYTLIIDAQDTMPTTVPKNQIRHRFDDGSSSCASLADNVFPTVEFPLSVLTEEDAATILDLFSDPLKANGGERSFYWENPKDGQTYVVQFLNDDITKTDQHRLGEYTSIDRIILLIIGYKAYYTS